MRDNGDPSARASFGARLYLNGNNVLETDFARALMKQVGERAVADDGE